MLILRNTVIAAVATQLLVLTTAVFAPNSLMMGLLGVLGALLIVAVILAAASGAAALAELIIEDSTGLDGPAGLAGLVASAIFMWAAFDSMWQFAPFAWVTVAGAVALATWIVTSADDADDADEALRRADRVRAAESALEDVDTMWLFDALNLPESAGRERRPLLGRVAGMPDGTEYALLRAHRKGVKADDVAPLIAAGSFTEAEADRLAREVA